MSYNIIYESNVVKIDIPKLDSSVKQMVRISIEEKLTTQPEVFGKPLRKSLKGYRKLRIGVWRVVFRIEKKEVKIFAIVHRRSAYQKALKRVNNQ